MLLQFPQKLFKFSYSFSLATFSELKPKICLDKSQVKPGLCSFIKKLKASFLIGSCCMSQVNKIKGIKFWVKNRENLKIKNYNSESIL